MSARDPKAPPSPLRGEHPELQAAHARLLALIEQQKRAADTPSPPRPVGSAQRLGPWWVAADDGTRSIQRTGRDALTYRDGDVAYAVNVDTEEGGGLAVFRNAVRPVSGPPLTDVERATVFTRAMTLLRQSGDSFVIQDASDLEL
ncbi:hypothetical protein [Deinococcus maricopensis]|uniref:Uncharacterized protein n=1 Tax=Deinococcus maricopensis (strain DSM 21211 / LMG 22137 / NRRL B-23946 / LB-34) TaxID=709986 RepID=E8U4V7_DEIML|nr:hypothetical protein [Deinococcus maricopensis]ADV66096.1 hypothetical protein Deima_0436 [Deinococcus maricopensis DSM 21211]